MTQTVQQGQVIVDAGHPITALDLETIDALGINASHLDAARLAGWFLLAVLLVGLLLAWVWRFRPEFWHRNNVLLLVGLMLAFATLALKVTAGRSILPFFVPTAAVGMLLAVLLDAGAATVVTLVIAVLAGAVNGSSLELAAYVFLGGLAGIIVVRRGDRLQVFVQAGLAVAVVNIAVVSTFVLLGERELDVTGVLQLWGASLASGAGAAVVAVGSFAALGNLFGILTAFQLLELANPSQPVLRRLLIETPGHVPPLADGRQSRRARRRGGRRRPAARARRGLLPRHRQAQQPARRSSRTRRAARTSTTSCRRRSRPRS